MREKEKTVETNNNNILRGSKERERERERERSTLIRNTHVSTHTHLHIQKIHREKKNTKRNKEANRREVDSEWGQTKNTTRRREKKKTKTGRKPNPNGRYAGESVHEQQQRSGACHDQCRGDWWACRRWTHGQVQRTQCDGSRGNERTAWRCCWRRRRSARWVCTSTVFGRQLIHPAVLYRAAQESTQPLPLLYGGELHDARRWCQRDE